MCIIVKAGSILGSIVLLLLDFVEDLEELLLLCSIFSGCLLQLIHIVTTSVATTATTILKIILFGFIKFVFLFVKQFISLRSSR
ncbi:MAG: hypothetical protein LBM05_00555 [Endomicrobium sp.]|nr:hypothetical protein [Endomicrobium sp.]